MKTNQSEDLKINGLGIHEEKLTAGLVCVCPLPEIDKTKKEFSHWVDGLCGQREGMFAFHEVVVGTTINVVLSFQSTLATLLIVLQSPLTKSGFCWSHEPPVSWEQPWALPSLCLKMKATLSQAMCLWHRGSPLGIHDAKRLGKKDAHMTALGSPRIVMRSWRSVQAMMAQRCFPVSLDYPSFCCDLLCAQAPEWKQNTKENEIWKKKKY